MWQRISKLFKGFLSLFVTGLEKANPKALIEAEKENLRAQIARFNTNLAQHAGFCERLLRQVKSLEVQEKELAAKAAANLRAGNREAAGQYALQLQTVKAQLEENRAQLADAEKTYQNLIQARDVTIREAKAKIQKLERMLSETEMLEAQAELQEMASGMISSIGGSGDTLDRVEGYLNERRDQAAGRARVAGSTIDMTDVQLKEGEQKALADQALAEFASAYGLEMPAPAASESAGSTPAAPAAQPMKEMGPSGS
ncbi:MAG: PspA/IM30 family protein [Acidobacteria bacterium]|nr:PspA/IM30 family protein [Acidobacteriota bacterium]MCB9378708.1 PspA/IM30 family protein [Holophagales bacterium]